MMQPISGANAKYATTKQCITSSRQHKSHQDQRRRQPLCFFVVTLTSDFASFCNGFLYNSASQIKALIWTIYMLVTESWKIDPFSCISVTAIIWTRQHQTIGTVIAKIRHTFTSHYWCGGGSGSLPITKIFPHSRGLLQPRLAAGKHRPFKIFVVIWWRRWLIPEGSEFAAHAFTLPISYNKPRLQKYDKPLTPQLFVESDAFLKYWSCERCHIDQFTLWLKRYGKHF